MKIGRFFIPPLAGKGAGDEERPAPSTCILPDRVSGMAPGPILLIQEQSSRIRLSIFLRNELAA